MEQSSVWKTGTNMNRKSSPFDGIEIGFLELDSTCCPQLFCEGRELGLNWKNDGENHFSAGLDFGILNLEIIPSANGIRIESSLEMNGTLPEKVIFTPLQIPKIKLGHVFFCGEKMGRSAAAQFPVKEPRYFEGRHCCALTREGETIIASTSLAL